METNRMSIRSETAEYYPLYFGVSARPFPDTHLGVTFRYSHHHTTCWAVRVIGQSSKVVSLLFSLLRYRIGEYDLISVVSSLILGSYSNFWPLISIQFQLHHSPLSMNLLLTTNHDYGRIWKWTQTICENMPLVFIGLQILCINYAIIVYSSNTVYLESVSKLQLAKLVVVSVVRKKTFPILVHKDCIKITYNHYVTFSASKFHNSNHMKVLIA